MKKIFWGVGKQSFLVTSVNTVTTVTSVTTVKNVTNLTTITTRLGTKFSLLFKPSPRDWRKTKHQSVVLRIFHAPWHIFCVWKNARTTFWCIVVSQVLGIKSNTAWNLKCPRAMPTLFPACSSYLYFKLLLPQKWAVHVILCFCCLKLNLLTCADSTTKFYITFGVSRVTCCLSPVTCR